MNIQIKRMLMVFSFSVAAALAIAGCGADLGDCPTDSSAAAQKTAGEQVVKNKCATAGCHSSENGASPAEGLDYTSASVVKTNAADMYSEASEGAMPPTGKLTDAEIESLRVYLSCTQ